MITVVFAAAALAVAIVTTVAISMAKPDSIPFVAAIGLFVSLGLVLLALAFSPGANTNTELDHDVVVVAGDFPAAFVGRLADGTLQECSVTRDGRHLVCGGVVIAPRRP
jgi:hypothetical protein